MAKNLSPQGEKWYSMEGFLSMKQLSSALAFLTSRKRLYFGLDEGQNQLVYFRDKADFDRNKDCQGNISLDGAICIPTANICIFVLHTASKKFEIETDNMKCAEVWLNALQRRKDLNDNHKTELSKIIQDSMKRYRSRSRSMPSDSEPSKPTMIRPRYPPTRRKTFKLDSLQPLPIDWSNNVNQSAPVTPISKNPPSTFPSHKSRLSRCISLKVGNNQRPVNLNGKSRLVVDNSKRRASLQESTTSIPTSSKANQPRHSLDTPPTWLDEWVTKWLDEQLIWADHHKRKLKIDAENHEIEDKTASPSACSPAETNSSGDNRIMNSSATTSRCETDDRSSIHSTGSQPDVYDELLALRQIDNDQKTRIHELTTQLEKLKDHAKINTKILDESALQDQNRVLKAEVIRMSEQCLDLDKKFQQSTTKCTGLEDQMDEFKREYVFLLQSSVHIPLHSNYDSIQVKLFGGDIHERRVKKLLAQAREIDPKLPTFESVTTTGSFHVDDFGFRHQFMETPLALHYICTQLNSHYNTQSDEYARLKARWRLVLEANPNKIENNKANRELCRRGIPRSLRPKVWRVLINQQVSDLKKKYGEYYYRNLCSSHGTQSEKIYCSTHQKQINLDLLRTMPSNVHFMSASCKGVNHLQAVLRAFCLHDPIIGYCQGMNFLAATTLLFVSPEDAFWFLIAVTERFFDRSYFDQNLSGAQADQEVLKELVEMKLPKLSKHLEECSIDLATACLNWFLALFFDAIPFEAMLRIWDCFLLEGPKVLFRFSIALLSLYQDEILERSDTISVMKVLKAAVRLTYDVDGLIKFAFDELQPFPRRTSLQQKQRAYLEVLQEKLNQRMRLRKILDVEVPQISQETSEKVCDLPIESIVWNEFKRGVGYVCAGNSKRGKLSMITIHSEATNLNALDLEFDCRPVSMVVPKKDMAFLSLLSNYIVAVQLNEHSAQILWEIKLPDVGLKLLHYEERLYAALANGTLTVLEKAFVNQPTALDLYNIPVAAAPITDAVIDDDYLYLAVACKVVILHKETLSPISSLYVASSACGSHVPMFEKIRAFATSPYGLWIITAHSSLIQLWLDSECQMLFDITFDHSHSSRRASIDDSDGSDMAEVYSILFHDDEIWIGTVDGYLMLYSVIQVDPSVFDRKSSLDKRTKSDVAAYSLHRYPPGKRLSPIQSNQYVDPNRMRQAMYYIPTAKERLMEEITSAKEYPEDARQTRKISVLIDQSTKQYKVNVEAVRQYSQESSSTTNNTTTDRKRHSSTTTCGENSEGSSTKGIIQSLRARRQERLKMSKGQSIDSAVSMFSGDSISVQRQSPACQTILETAPSILSPRAETDPEQHTKSKEHIPLKRRTHSDSTQLVNMSSPSLEYDDSFDLYPELEDQIAQEIGLLEDTLCQSSPTAKSVQIPVRKMSNSVFGKSRALTIDESDASSMGSFKSKHALQRSQSSASESSIEVAVRNKRPSANQSISRVNSQRRPPRPKLRRKDLEIEENATVLIAVKEPPPQLELPTPSSSSSSVDHPSNDAFESQNNNHLSAENHGNNRWIDYTTRKPSLITNGVEELLEEKAVNSSLSLSLQMKLKVSDKPLKCIALTKFGEESVVVTGAGNYGDEEAVLRWRRDKSSGLWINDPLVDASVVGRKRTVLSAGSVKRKTKADIKK